MMFHFFRRGTSEATIASLYGTIVAQARAAPFYRNCGVPDTVNGRFEMVLLHIVLVLRRLEDDPATRPLGQALFDWFCRDMDGSLREMGIGDLAVPAKMRKIGEAFYGRQAAYAAAFAAPDSGELISVLARNVFGGAHDSEASAAKLVAYARTAERLLATQDVQAISRAELAFPDAGRIGSTA